MYFHCVARKYNQGMGKDVTLCLSCLQPVLQEKEEKEEKEEKQEKQELCDLRWEGGLARRGSLHG